jgi:hypothetical protein
MRFMDCQNSIEVIFFRNIFHKDSHFHFNYQEILQSACGAALSVLGCECCVEIISDEEDKEREDYKKNL